MVVLLVLSAEMNPIGIVSRGQELTPAVMVLMIP
jgi:hypothetical protein